MERRVRDLTKGLAEVREESNYYGGMRYAQFIHQSVSDYFIQNGLQVLDKGASGFESSVGRAHFQLSRSCIKYIAMEETKQAFHEQGAATLNDDRDPRFHFLKYAVNSWIVHAQAAESQRESQKDLLRLFDRPPGDLLLIWSGLHQDRNPYYYHSNPTLKELSQTNLLHIASKYNLPSVVDEVLSSNDAELNFRDYEGLTALSHAVRSRHMTIMRILLGRNDIDVDCGYSNDRTPLFDAVDNCDEAAIRLLLDRGAKVNCKDIDGFTPLSSASEQGHWTVMRLLIDRGAEVNCRDQKGRSPLCWACKQGDEAVVQLLLDRGAEVNHKDENGQTPLLWMTSHYVCDEAVVRLLLDQGAEANCRDKQGRTPLYWAVWRGSEILAQLLLDRGAEVNCRDESEIVPLYWQLCVAVRQWYGCSYFMVLKLTVKMIMAGHLFLGRVNLVIRIWYKYCKMQALKLTLKMRVAVKNKTYRYRLY